MLDIKKIREEVDTFRTSLNRRGPQFAEGLDGILAADAKRRKALSESDTLKNKKKSLSAEVGQLKKQKQDATALMEEVKGINEQIKSLDDQVDDLDAEIQEALLGIPNVPHESVPTGKDDSANEVQRVVGEVPELGFKAKSHLELGEALDILDLERAAKIAGSRFAIFKGDGARLLRAIINFMLDVQTGENGYQEIYPPVLVNKESLLGTGQLPKFEEDLFKLADDPFYLIPTAEVPVTNVHRDEILKKETLPIKYAAYTVCFRREAGSYGKDTQGIIRQHQFDKVELVKFANPETSYDELDRLVEDAESILKKLGLAYRVVTLCTGDLGFSAAKTFDLEVWLPSQDTYREISSCSNFTDYQARRAKIRSKGKDGGKPELVHTLNGSGLAAGRLFVAILENFQTAEGSIVIPDALRPYMAGKDRIGP